MKRKNNDIADSFQISGRSAWVILASFGLLTFIVIGLNVLDKNRKFSQFQELNAVLVKTEYPSRISHLVEKFDPTDSTVIHELTLNINTLIDEIGIIDDAGLYIRLENKFYKLIKENYDCTTQLVDELNFLPKDIVKIIEYIDTGAPEIQKLYTLTNTGKDNYTIIKVGNGYLQLTDYRY